MMILCFDVCKQSVSLNGSENPVNKSVNYLELSFTFKGTDWDNLTKRVVFKDRSNAYCKELDNQGKVLVPHEVLTGDFFVFSLYGLGIGNMRVTTNQMKVYLAESGYTGTIEPVTPATPSIVDDIYNKLNNVVEMEVVFEDETTETYNVVVK